MTPKPMRRLPLASVSISGSGYRLTSMTSSTVIVPTSRFSESTTGTATTQAFRTEQGTRMINRTLCCMAIAALTCGSAIAA